MCICKQQITVICIWKLYRGPTHHTHTPLTLHTTLALKRVYLARLPQQQIILQVLWPNAKTSWNVCRDDNDDGNGGTRSPTTLSITVCGHLLLLLCCCSAAVAVCILEQSLSTHKHKHTRWRIHLDLWFSLSLFSRSLRERHCGALNKIGAFVVVASRAFERVYVCVCERETCGQIFPPFFFIRSCITCTSLLSYLFCYVYTAENNVQSRQEICKKFQLRRRQLLILSHTFSHFICILIVFFIPFCTHTTYTVEQIGASTLHTLLINFANT